MEEIKTRQSEDKRYPLCCAVIYLEKIGSANILVCGYQWKPIDSVTAMEAVTLQYFFL